MSDLNQHEVYDVAIVGGGINGAGIARDAAGRGYKVVLIEKDDLASHTSSSSSKLIHGGLRYLEYYEFKLVAKALREREILLKIAPHIIWPLEIVLPHNSAMRPLWMIRLGLWLYDNLSKRNSLPASKTLKLTSHVTGKALKDKFVKGFSYADCWVQDARLVVLNAIDACQHQGCILTHTQCQSASWQRTHWNINLKPKKGREFSLKAKCLVNATGPWASDFLKQNIAVNNDQQIRLVSGGHIVVKKIFSHDQAYIFQNKDNRIVFALPYEGKFTLIGTTEREVSLADEQQISEAECDYLCQSVNAYFKAQISPEDIVWTYSGTRPLLQDGSDDPTATTREYKLEFNQLPGPCLSIFGGKITTYRALAQSAVDLIDKHFGFPCKPWTKDKPLPGGDFANADFPSYLSTFKKKHPWLGEKLAWHYLRNYGTRVDLILNKANNLEQLGELIGNDLYTAEVDYLIKHEWALDVEDILWRRTKWGLHLNKAQIDRLTDYLNDYFVKEESN